MGSWVQAPLVVVVARDQTPTCIVVAGVGANPSGGDRLLLAAGGMWLRAEDLTRCAPCFGIRASCPRHYPRRARHRVATGIELQLLGRYPFRVAVPSAVNLQRIHGFGSRFKTCVAFKTVPMVPTPKWTSSSDTCSASRSMWRCSPRPGGSRRRSSVSGMRSKTSCSCIMD